MPMVSAAADLVRYVSHVQGVLLAHWDHTFLDQTVNIINECPFGVADIEFEALIWAPKIGQKLCTPPRVS
jgi:DNA-directed RNA polymerase I subunit RPA43